MYVKKILLSFLLSSSLLPIVRAQMADKQKAIESLRSLSERYKNYKSLSFTIAYKYSAEDKPGLYADSLKGSFTMSGSRYRYIMDSTEFIGDKDRVVVLYKQDRVMYLAKSSPAMQSGNPMAKLDSILLKNDSVRIRMDETKKQQTIVLLFPSGSPTREIRFVIDRGSGYMTRMVQVVLSKQLYDPSVRPLVEGHSSYAIVETDFTNYREGNGDEQALDQGQYFKKEGKQYMPLPPYDSYKLFLGTPDF